MRRPLVTTCALALALATAALFAQTPPPATPPPAQPPVAAPTPAPAAPKVAFTTPAGLLLVQVKPDQTAAFEELVAKLRDALAKTDNAELKQQAGFKVYKAAEGMQGNALYVVVVDPAVPNVEYQFLDVLNKTLTDDQKRAPETREMFARFAAAFASLNKLNLTPVGGGQ
jgi:hypothetical protein